MNDEAEHEFAIRLTDAERDQDFPNLRPSNAAALIVIDRSAATPKILLGRRHSAHKFMPDKFVFPGGRVEARDRAVPCASPLHPAAEQALMRGMKRPSESMARALAIAALRETYEETGLLIGRKRTAGRAEERGGSHIFAKAGIDPDLAALRFVARAITPPRRPRRFDTRFFAADAAAVAHRIEGVAGPDAELIELVWLPIAEAKSLDIADVTRVILMELEARIAAGFDHALPVPFYRMVQGRFRRELL
jgi:8-oxo-dGTP pyrophosphatase MutT (NUDIX family)